MIGGWIQTVLYYNGTFLWRNYHETYQEDLRKKNQTAKAVRENYASMEQKLIQTTIWCNSWGLGFIKMADTAVSILLVSPRAITRLIKEEQAREGRSGSGLGLQVNSIKRSNSPADQRIKVIQIVFLKICLKLFMINPKIFL